MKRNTNKRDTIVAISCSAVLIALFVDASRAETTINVFQSTGIQFGGDANWNRQSSTSILDNGRIVERIITLPALGPFSRVTTNLNVNAASDAWDRAGSIYLSTATGDIEIHKFITAFGGSTSHQLDITNLLPILNRGPLKVRAFIDTWVQSARTIDFSLTVTDNTANRAPTYARPLFNDQDWRAGDYLDDKVSVSVRAPKGLGKVMLSYLPSGHASDGSGGDEFTQRTHRIFIDGVEVWQGIPWRTDGRNFRGVNPTSGRWGDVWSSDLDRSGWIPGDDVDPILVDVTQYLADGIPHTIDYRIDGIRPGDSNGYGYWRTSSYLTGFAQDAGPADFDYNGVVDGADFLTWQRGFGRTEQINNGFGDADRNGTVDVLDLAIWQSAYGSNQSLIASAAVPEPGSIILLGIACFAFRRAQTRRR